MPKDYFKPENMTSLADIESGARIYLIGVCGVAMGQLAVALAQKGYNVSGSDKEFYEPMGSFLENAGLTLHRGYAAENVPSDVDLVVIGNAISYGHPEVAVVEEKGLPYTCFPKLLFEAIIEGRHSIVVSGTHGKSTTAAMTAHILRELGSDPSYFIGGVVDSLPTSLHAGSKKFSVVEGDEYDDVFFSKKAKFLHYKPDTCIVNAIEFDHADLYDSVEQIAETFGSMISGMTAEGTAICCLDFPEIKNRLQSWKSSASCSFITFGEDEDADFRILSVAPKGLTQDIVFRTPAGEERSFFLPTPGMFNARNALAAYIATTHAGLSPEAVSSALASFKSVRRRQEVRFTSGDYYLIEDFAHHPTAVAQCLTAIRAAMPSAYIRAVFEPRSNTSRRSVFREAYLQAFHPADSAILCQVTKRAIDSGQELLDVDELCTQISESGTPCVALPDADAIARRILETKKENEVTVVMSNGSFGGLLQKLIDGLTAK